jgi:hypothetical protein
MSRTDTHSARELWQKAAGGFDLVIIDDRTGAQSLIPAMLAYKPATKIILMSGHPENYQSSNILTLPKPVSPAQLTDAIAQP